MEPPQGVHGFGGHEGGRAGPDAPRRHRGGARGLGHPVQRPPRRAQWGLRGVEGAVGKIVSRVMLAACVSLWPAANCGRKKANDHERGD